MSVSFDSELGEGWNLLEGTLRVAAPRQADLAVVVLDEPAAVVPADLPEAGEVESLARGSLVTSVGYGFSGRAADGSFVYDGLRRQAESPVQKSSRLYLTISTRAAGPCLGDSGGPQLAGNTALSITSGGSKDCSGRADGYRLDSAQARAFLGGYVPLP